MMTRVHAASLAMILCSPVLATTVWAMDSCTGEYSATALQPLPQPTLVGLVVQDGSPRTQQLARDFSAGLRQAGVTLSTTPNVKLSMTYQIYRQTGGKASLGGSGGGGGGSGYDSWGTANSWDALQGGVTLQQPDMPDYDAFSPAPAPQPAQLMARVEARDAASNAVDWVSVIQCTIQASSKEKLVFDLGVRVGAALGKRVKQTPL